MGVGPVKAIPKALQMAGIPQDQVDLFEINEAFASQCIHFVRELGLDEDLVNVNGGTIAARPSAWMHGRKAQLA